MSAKQLNISELDDEQRQSVVMRLSEQPLPILQAARALLDERCCLSLKDRDDVERLRLLEEAIIYKAFENILDSEAAEEQEKYNNLVHLRTGSEE